jgi:hypothetical protein
MEPPDLDTPDQRDNIMPYADYEPTKSDPLYPIATELPHLPEIKAALTYATFWHPKHYGRHHLNQTITLATDKGPEKTIATLDYDDTLEIWPGDWQQSKTYTSRDLSDLAEDNWPVKIEYADPKLIEKLIHTIHHARQYMDHAWKHTPNPTIQQTILYHKHHDIKIPNTPTWIYTTILLLTTLGLTLGLIGLLK